MPAAILPLAQVLLTNAAADIYAPPAGAQQVFIAEFTAIWIANNDTVARAVTLQFGPTGALTASNNIAPAWSVPANTTLFVDATEYSIVVPFGYHLQGFADVTGKVVVTCFGQQTV